MAIELPECWSDDLRMSVLFSPFKDRNINPHSYDGKMKFWKDLIPQFTVNNPSTLSVTLTQLMTVFTRKGKTPQCLGLVLESLVRDKTLSLASEYDHSLQVLNQKRNSWGAWGYQTLFISPVKWAVSSVAGKMLNMKPQIDCTTKFIITSHMDKQAYKLLAVIQSSEDQTKSARNILSRQEVQEHCCKTSVCDSKDLELLIDHMEAHGMLQKIICDFGIYYKFLPRGSKSTPITDVEHGIVKLKHSKELLESQMEAAHKEVNQLQSLIKQELRLGQKAKALRLLRKRKGMEKLLDSRLNSLTSIEEILEQIYSAESNALVAEAYKHGAAALKMTNQQTPISQVSIITLLYC